MRQTTTRGRALMLGLRLLPSHLGFRLLWAAVNPRSGLSFRRKMESAPLCGSPVWLPVSVFRAQSLSIDDLRRLKRAALR